MIHITEKKLKAAIQIALGGNRAYTNKIEADLIYHIIALSLPYIKEKPDWDSLKDARLDTKLNKWD